MARTYGPLGPRGENQDPAFLRSIALLGLSRRGGPSGARAPSSELDYVGNPLARERYARSILDEKLRGMVAGREAAQAGPDLARRQLGLDQQRLSMEGGLGQQSLEEQIRAAMAGEGIQGRRLGLEEQFGADRRMRGEREFGLAQGASGLAERSLEEQIRAAIEREKIDRERIGVERDALNVPKNPEQAAQGALIEQQARATRSQALLSWVQHPYVQQRLLQFVRGGGKNGAADAVKWIIQNNPISPDVTTDEVKRIMTDLIGQFAGVFQQMPGGISDFNQGYFDAIQRGFEAVPSQ